MLQRTRHLEAFVRRHGAALAAGLLILALAPAAWGEPPSEPKKWEFTVMPYFWLPGVTGDLTIARVTVPVEASLSDILTKSDFAFGLMMTAEAWYERRWGLLFNGEWMVLKANDNRITLLEPRPPFFPGLSFEFDAKMNMGFFEFGGLYSFGERPFGSGPGGPTWEVQPLVGARVTVLNTEIDLDGGDSNDVGKTWADPILGARGRIRFGNDNRWSWVMRGDFGGFGAGSELTWGAQGGFGYDFHMRSVASTVLLGARALYQDFEDNGGRFRWDMTQYGPFVALALHF
jgi:hypothetical protein